MWGTPAAASAASCSSSSSSSSSKASGGGGNCVSAGATPSGAAASAASAAASTGGELQTVLFRQHRTPVGFLLSKAVDTLKQNQSRELHVKELEKLLIQQGFGDLHPFFQTNSWFLRSLSCTRGVAYNALHKTLSFLNPFEEIRDAQTLKAKIIFEGGTTGLRIDAELLSSCAGAVEFINELLQSRQVRAVRTTANHLRGKLKCMRLGNGQGGRPGEACDLYATRRCSNCYKNLQGLIIYPLGEAEIEDTRLALDRDIKQLWDEIELPTLEEILKQTTAGFDMARPGQAANGARAGLKKRNEEKKQSRHRNKFRRIQNTHLFTADELRAFANGGSLQNS